MLVHTVPTGVPSGIDASRSTVKPGPENIQGRAERSPWRDTVTVQFPGILSPSWVVLTPPTASDANGWMGSGMRARVGLTSLNTPTSANTIATATDARNEILNFISKSSLDCYQQFRRGPIT
jgi:hypothetical protein